MNIDSLFSSSLNYISSEMQFSLKDKITLSVFPDNILESTFNEAGKKKLISPFAYFVTVCKSKATKQKLNLDYSLINKIKSHPEVQALLLEELKHKDDQQENQKGEHQSSSFSGNSENDSRFHGENQQEFSTTFETRPRKTEQDLLEFKINQLAGEINRSCYADADGTVRFHPNDFRSPYATAQEISDAVEKQKQLDLSDPDKKTSSLDELMSELVKKITPRIQETAAAEFKLYQEAQKEIIPIGPIPVRNNRLIFTKDQSVKELATFNALLESDWFKNIIKKNPALAKEKKALAMSMMTFHMNNINE